MLDIRMRLEDSGCEMWTGISYLRNGTIDELFCAK
jgi:hypothetical protein